MSERIPVECFPVSTFIQEEMVARKMSIERLAKWANWPLEWTKDVLSPHDYPLAYDTAVTLSHIFATSVEYWLNLDLAYQRWRAD